MECLYVQDSLEVLDGELLDSLEFWDRFEVLDYLGVLTYIGMSKLI